MLQEQDSNDLIMFREDFTVINEQDIVIYDMVIEYQAVVTTKEDIEADIVEFKPELQERDPRDIVIIHPNIT